MIPLYEKNVVLAESGMFAGCEKIDLMFPAEKIIEVKSHCDGKVFLAGKDFLHQPGSAEIIRLPDSEIPYFTKAQLHPTDELRLHPHPDANAIDNACDGGYLLFNNKNLFALNQIDITYIRSSAVPFPVKRDWQSDRLMRLRSKLAAGENISITLIGDSISEGFNATAFTEIAPFAPPYIGQVSEELQNIFHCRIGSRNRAIAGTGIQHADRIAEKWLTDRPDLMIIAYGMNNFAKMPVAEFLDRMAEIIRRSRESRGDTEFLIVIPMTGHPLWNPTKPGPDAEYAAAMKEFAQTQDPGVAFTDVQQIWREFLKRKSFYDLTGNGVNHPNDFGHRIYASAILETLTGKSYFDPAETGNF